MPAFLVLVGRRPLTLGRTYTLRVEAQDAEAAAAQVLEARGGDRSMMREADPVDGYRVFDCGTQTLVVERLSPTPRS